MSTSGEFNALNPAVSSSGAWKSSNSTTLFALASANTLRRKGVPEWREYNRHLTAAYLSLEKERDSLKSRIMHLTAENESILMERNTLRGRNSELERDVQELDAAMEMCDQAAATSTTNSSNDIRGAHASRIAELESTLAQAQLDISTKDQEILDLRSQSEILPKGSTDTHNGFQAKMPDKSVLHLGKTPAYEGISSLLSLDDHTSLRALDGRISSSGSSSGGLFEDASDNEDVPISKPRIILMSSDDEPVF
ncbi:MAG: hypothetical protein LQ337_006923 [Flavoplaca oasis]|nr:MAG: hypothetical protein LQ337_006923 [Flavoplaca oasis]